MEENRTINTKGFTLPEFLYVFVMFAWSLLFQRTDNQIMKYFPETPKDVTNRNSVRIPLYTGCAITMVPAFFLPVLSMIMMPGIDCNVRTYTNRQKE